MKVAKVTPKLELSIHESIFSRFPELIGGECDLVEFVHARGLAENDVTSEVVMVVDEEFLCRDNLPELNPLGSYLYGTLEHGSPILGNILFVGECNYGRDIRSLTDAEIEQIREWVEILKKAQKVEYP